MEWFDYETTKSIDQEDCSSNGSNGNPSVDSDEDYDDGNDDDGSSSSSSSSKGQNKHNHSNLSPKNFFSSKEKGGKVQHQENTTTTTVTALDDIFQSLEIDKEIDKDSQSYSTKEKFNDEQTQATDRSGKSQKSARSGTSYASGSMGSGMSLTEQLAKIGSDAILADEEGDVEEEKSVSASSWFTWGRSATRGGGGSQNTGEQDAASKSQVSKSSLDCEESHSHDIDLDDPLDKSHSSGQYIDLDLDARNEEVEAHPNQALFDIIEQGFDSTESFRIKGRKRALKATEVKLCFAAYIFVFTPPKPVEFAMYYNHEMDKELRNDFLYKQEKKKGGKKRWFKWKDEANSEKAGSSTKNQPKLESGKYTYEVVPSSIVFSLWEEVLEQVGIRLSKLSSKEKMQALNYVKETLASVGLIDCNMIDFSDEASQSGRSDKMQEFEFIAARQAINGQYGHYLRRTYTKIKECLEGNEKNIFDAASIISNDDDVCMRDYCAGMLPYTWFKAQKFLEAELKLCEQSFVKRRLDYFGLLEGTTIHVTDIELMIEQIQATPPEGGGINIEALMKRSYSVVKSYIEQNVKSTGDDDDIDDYLCEEAGKALHLVATSFLSQGFDDEALVYLIEALRLKQLFRSPLDEEIGSVTLSDTHHCIGLAHRALGDFDKSHIALKEALAMRSKLLGEKDLRIAESCQKMVSL